MSPKQKEKKSQIPKIIVYGVIRANCPDIRLINWIIIISIAIEGRVLCKKDIRLALPKKFETVYLHLQVSLKGCLGLGVCEVVCDIDFFIKLCYVSV